MAASATPEPTSADQEIKRRSRRRLIGALALGALAVVFLPMIFDNEPKGPGAARGTREISVKIPSKEEQAPLAAPSSAPAASSAPATPAAAPVALAPPVAAVAPAPAPPVAEKRETAPETAKPGPAANPPVSAAGSTTTEKPQQKKGFVVQLGAFSDGEKASQAIAKAKQAGLAAHSERITVKAGVVTRVRVGPFETREKADAALARIKLAGGEGSIVPLK